MDMEDNLNIQDFREPQEDEQILEILTKISQRCKTDEEGKQAKNHCMDILRYNSWLLETDVLDVFLSREGIISSFEVSVNESLDNRISNLMEQIKEKTAEYGIITYVMVNFLITKKCDFQLEELYPFGDWMQSSPLMTDDTDVWWHVSFDDNSNNQIRAIVLVMHQN